MPGRFFPRIICMSRRIDGSAPDASECSAWTRARARASVAHTSAPSASATRRIVEFPRWEFNFQMRRATRALARPGAALSRAHNFRMQCEFPRYRLARCTPRDLLEIPSIYPRDPPGLAAIKYSSQGAVAERAVAHPPNDGSSRVVNAAFVFTERKMFGARIEKGPLQIL